MQAGQVFGPVPTDAGPVAPATAGPALLDYGPLWLTFSDPEWERDFRLHFSALLLKADVFWALSTFALTIQFYFQIGAHDPTRYAEHLPDMIAFASFTTLICLLALRRPSVYVRVRTLLLFASRAHHQWTTIARLGTELAPPDGAPLVASRLPLDTVEGTVWRLLASCLFAAVIANGYQLVGRWQVASVVLNLASTLTKNARLCSVSVSPAYDTRRRDIHAVFTRWTDRALAWGLPLTAGAEPIDVALPCAVFRLWTLFVLGCIAPLVLANLLEEWSRLSFLKAKGQGILTPSLGWRLIHALATLFFGCWITWELATVLAPLLL